MKLLKLGYIACGVILGFVIIEILIELYIESNNDDYGTNFQEYQPTSKDYEIIHKEIKVPIVLWWSSLISELGVPTKCGNVSCYFTHNRRFKDHPLQKAVLFYGSELHVLDLPLPRKRGQLIWALFHEESPKNFPPLAFKDPLSMFDLTATFSRHSNFPLTLQFLENEDVLKTKRYLVPFREKTSFLRSLAPVLYIQSSCNTPSDRDGYVEELMKYIKVDSYGKCLNNKQLPDDIADPTDNIMSDKFLHFISRYKFIIAFENAICHDYVTEKLWRSLIVGSIPIYYGSPTVADWLPNNKSTIFAMDFDSPKSLARYLHRLNKNETEYNSYLMHKLSSDEEMKVSNTLLKSTLKGRSWQVNGDSEESSHVEHFECFVCNAVHDYMKYGTLKNIKHVTQEHYNCEKPVSPLTRQMNVSNWWSDAWRIAGCEGLVMSELVNADIVNYTRVEFYSVLENYYHNNIC